MADATYGPPAGAKWRDWDRWESGVCLACYDEQHSYCEGVAYGGDCPCSNPYHHDDEDDE